MSEPAAERPEPDRPSSRTGPVNYELRSIHQITASCRQLLGKAHDYEAVAMEIWLEAWGTHGCTNTALVPVPYTQIKRRCIDERRKVATRQKYDEAAATETEWLPSEDELELLKSVLHRAGLTSNEYEAVYRRYVHNQPVHLIAQNTGWSGTAINKMLAHAVAKLRSAMRTID